MSLGQDATPAAPTPASALGRGLKIVLIMSLAVNLLIAGAVGAHLFRAQVDNRQLFGDDWARGRELVRGLPRERRRMIFKKIRQHRSEFRQGRQDIRAARREVGRALRSGRSGGFHEVFDALAEAESNSLKKFRALMADVTNDLTAAERQKFADHLEHHPRWRP